MLKIHSEKIWKLLQNDKKIQKELKKYIKEEQENFLKAQSMVEQTRLNLQHLQEKKENLKHVRDHLDDEINHKNADISFLEIRKIFSNARIKRLQKILASTCNEYKRKKYQRLIMREQQHILSLENKQHDIQKDISELLKQREDCLESIKGTNKDLSKQYDQLENDQKNLSFYEEELNTKKDRFYQTAFQEASQNFKPCQDLVVPDLEKNKKMTRDEAKRKANPILIDQEYLLQSPEQLKVRRLTNNEKEEYRKIN